MDYIKILMGIMILVQWGIIVALVDRALPRGSDDDRVKAIKNLQRAIRRKNKKGQRAVKMLQDKLSSLTTPKFDQGAINLEQEEQLTAGEKPLKTDVEPY